MPPKSSLRVHMVPAENQPIQIPPCYMQETNLFLPWFENTDLLYKEVAENQNEELQSMLHEASMRTKQSRPPQRRVGASLLQVANKPVKRQLAAQSQIDTMSKRRRGRRVAAAVQPRSASSSSASSASSPPDDNGSTSRYPTSTPISYSTMQPPQPSHQQSPVQQRNWSDTASRGMHTSTQLFGRGAHHTTEVDAYIERDDLLAELTAQLNTYPFLPRPSNINTMDTARLSHMVRRNARTAATFFSSRTVKMTFMSCLFLLQIALSVILKIDVSGFWTFQRSLMPEYDMVCAEIASVWQPLASVGPVQQLIQSAALYTSIYVLHDFMTRFGGTNFLQALCSLVSIKSDIMPNSIQNAWSMAEAAHHANEAAAPASTTPRPPQQPATLADDVANTMPRPPPPLFPR